MANEDMEPKRSPAKAAVAMQKPRDQYGRFLSGDELANYQAQQQQQQFMAERNRVNELLGRNSMNPLQTTNPIPSQPGMPAPQNNFQAIINANKVGGATPQTEDDKWNLLLGRKRRIL